MTIALTTTRNKPKSFSFSYSKLKNFETCPKRHYHYEIKKDVKEEAGEALLYGNTVHDLLAKRMEGEPLPKHFEHLEKWAQRVLVGGGTILAEQKLAITEDFGPCEWFAKNAWYRGIADVIKINGPVALAVDWKSGKIKEDGSQLALMAACVFAHHAEVQRIRTEFVWFAEDATTRADFSRDDMVGMWKGLLPRVTLLRNAYEKQDFPPKPGGLCRRYCQVVSCPHHGG